MSAKELNIGDYVRTKNGCICKIININDFREPALKYGVEASYLKDIMFIGDENIIKSSPNIIDLIEEDDYVNGEKVIYAGYSMYKETKSGLKGIGDKIVLIGIYNKWGFDKKTLKERDIKNIVTREQYEANKYKIGE